MLSFFCALARQVFGNKLCPYCKGAISVSYPEHLFSHHLSTYNINNIKSLLKVKNFENLLKLAENISSLHSQKCLVCVVFCFLIPYSFIFLLFYLFGVY